MADLDDPRGDEAQHPGHSEPDAGPLELTAFVVGQTAPHPWIAAPATRAWMDATPDQFANRCLPLLIANQAGWLLLNPSRVLLRWDGTRARGGLVVESDDPACVVSSHFGQGIATWSMPYLFRTPPQWDLLVRGPANCPKDGVYALDGIVETDWTVSTFTMNWQLTRPGLDVVFEEDEPYAMLVPQRRGDVERFQPRLRSAEEDRVVKAEHEEWADSRLAFNAELKHREPGELGPGWQRDYFRGRSDQARKAGHRTKLRIHEPEWVHDAPTSPPEPG